MHTKTFAYNGATIRVSTETGGMYIDRMVAEITLGIYDNGLSTREAMRRGQFAAVYCQSEVEGTLGFTWPENPGDKDTMLTACEAWLALPGGVVKEWISTVNQVNDTPNDPDLKPPEQVEKKD